MGFFGDTMDWLSGGKMGKLASKIPGLAQQAADTEKARHEQAFNWGGDPNAAAQDIGMYRGRANQYGDLRAPDLDYSGSAKYMGMGDQARGDQGQALDLQRQAAMGNAPSQAAILMRQGNDQAIANQLSMAAGARGPAAMAMAQQQAAGNSAALQTNNMNSTGALRAQEMANARQAYMGGASGMRAQDLGYAQQMAQQAQAQGQLGLGYRNLGLQGQLGYDQMAFNVGNAQMNARQNMFGMDEAHWKAQMARDQASKEAANANYMKAAAVAAAAATGGAGAGILGAGAAAGAAGGGSL